MKENKILTALVGEDISPKDLNNRAYLSKLSLYSLEGSCLRKVGMHNTSKINEVGIQEQVNVPRPRNHQLGKYLREGYHPFIDLLSRKYFLIRKKEPSALLYNDNNKNFEQVSPEALFVED